MPDVTSDARSAVSPTSTPNAELTAGAGAIASLAPREDFPILAREINGKPLAFLDSAASTQKPNAVLDAMDRFARSSYANIHRGAYTLSEESTRAYERARKTVATRAREQCEFTGRRRWSSWNLARTRFAQSAVHLSR